MDQMSHQLSLSASSFESAAFRVGQVARRLQAEHPELAVGSVTCAAGATSYQHAEDLYVHARLELRAGDLEAARAWADALGADLTLKIRESKPFVSEVGECTAVIDGIDIEVSGRRTLSPEEADAWRAQQNDGTAENGAA
ncbi:hypothetical protein [Streptomyces sp. NPDC048242]|uniref:hypothetical protein n=1 Tax=Streptomyces sp. NPDC048242 TaxID=3155026 RepID=UPI00342CCC15